jgi:hypothetical protein
MDRLRILELAAEMLQKQRGEIEAEIEMIRAELNGAIPKPATDRKPAAARANRRRKRTLAERKAQSRIMKERWAKRKAQAGKPLAIAKKLPAAAKPRVKTAAAKKALSLKMKEIWAKRKAEAAKKAK